MQSNAYETKGKGTRTLQRLVVSMVAVAMTASAVPFLAPTAEATHGGIHFGFSINGVDQVTELRQSEGLEIKYGSFWTGNWNDNQQWGGETTWLQNAYTNGITPMIQWWYWGDKIAANCIDTDCGIAGDPRTKSEWDQMAHELGNIIQTTMQGEEAVVILETEFHKNGIDRNDDPNYPNSADKFDLWMKNQVDIFHSYGVKVAIGFGHWNTHTWFRFADSVGAADYTGTMILFSCYRESLSTYAGTDDKLIGNVQHLSQTFGKPVFVDDWGLSSYQSQNPSYPCQTSYQGENVELLQEKEVQDLFGRIGELKAEGVVAIVFRSLNDNAGKDPEADWHKAAEAYWGFKRAPYIKPAYNDMVDGIRAENGAGGGGGGGPLPSSIEAEDFAVKSTGGLSTSASYSGGEAWNIWTNGHIEQTVNNPSAGSTGLTIQAKGSLAGPDLPHMRLHINGFVEAEWDVSTETVQPYTTTVPLPAGTVTFRIEFTNDYMSGSDDRNLIVDVLEIGSSTPTEQWSREAEAMTCTQGGQSSDATASGGLWWNLWANGHCDATITTSVSGDQDLKIRARGDPAAGVWPQAVVYVDGSAVATWDIIDDDWLTYVVSVDMTSGSHSLEIHFVNDAIVNGDDRNLHLDVASVVG